MSSERQQPRRLIEVDLPIRALSEHSRREKYVGTVSSLHLWWARRPLAACRGVVAGALWLDPADELAPPAYVATVERELFTGARRSTAIPAGTGSSRFMGGRSSRSRN